MKKTVCELFAGVGGFRCGFNGIDTIEDAKKKEKWKTVWFSQWEPADKARQWAWGCYTNRFGYLKDLDGNDTTNIDIAAVDKSKIPDFNLLCGGFPCQDYSVASTLAASKGIEGKKGVLFWSILDTIQAKNPPFILLENVDRLLKSPASQRGRDFSIILACLRDEGYTVEWRVINAAEYGYQQRRRRTYIFAYKNETKYSEKIIKKVKYDKADPDNPIKKIILKEGFFAKTFPVESDEKLVKDTLPLDLVELSKKYKFWFENSGIMKDGVIFTMKTNPVFSGSQITLGDILETGAVDKSFFIPKERLYYTSPEVCNSDETKTPLSASAKKTWQYIKGGKKINRKAANGHEYLYSEGSMPMIDEYDKPARTILTSEGGFSRTTHIVRDKKTKKIRLLTPIELERIQGFPDDWTKECVFDGEKVEMTLSKRRFMMGNALVVDLIKQMEPELDRIFKSE